MVLPIDDFIHYFLVANFDDEIDQGIETPYTGSKVMIFIVLLEVLVAPFQISLFPIFYHIRSFNPLVQTKI